MDSLVLTMASLAFIGLCILVFLNTPRGKKFLEDM